MATRREFNNMLLEYLPHDLLFSEFKDRCYIMNEIEVDDNWAGGPLPLRSRTGVGTSISFGGLTDEDDIDSFQYEKAVVNEQKEVWGAIVWEGRDIREHKGKGKFKLQSVLNDLPGQIEDFINYMKEVVSHNFLNGDFLTKLLEPGKADGIVRVRNIERLKRHQKIVFKSPTGVTKAGYVSIIEVQSNRALFVSERKGTNPVDLSAFPTGSKLHIVGSEIKGASFTSIVDQLDTSNPDYFSIKKSVDPFYQAVNFDGAAMGLNADNFVEKLFDMQMRGKLVGRGNPTHWLMSWKHIGVVCKWLERRSGAYRHTTAEPNVFGWQEVKIWGPKGTMTCVGLIEKDEDTILGLDFSTIFFHTNEGFAKEEDPQTGSVYTRKRTPRGHRYICDIGCYGELVVTIPSHNILVKNADFPDTVDTLIVNSNAPLFTEETERLEIMPTEIQAAQNAVIGSAALNAFKGNTTTDAFAAMRKDLGQS